MVFLLHVKTNFQKAHEVIYFKCWTKRPLIGGVSTSSPKGHCEGIDQFQSTHTKIHIKLGYCVH